MRVALSTALVVLLLPAAATATGSLTISLLDSRSRPVEGTVSATPRAGGAGRSCTTKAGRCVIRALGAGEYRVTARTVRGVTPGAVIATVRDGRAVRARLAVPDAPQATAPPQSAVVASAPSEGATHGGPGQPGTPGVGVREGSLPTTTGLRQSVPRTSPPPVTASGGPRTGMMMSSTSSSTTRDLGRGDHWVIRGSAQDQRSRPVEGSVTISKDGTNLGTVQTSGGSFQVYDLEPGRYHLSFTCVTGQRTARDVTVQSGPAASVRLTIQR
ncbi:MAG: hypothetical protein HYY06_05160 [Deltaproteobacteria bacterium]|nr:hypothetical protein [Deltaproteobacteria bacterium]